MLIYLWERNKWEPSCRTQSGLTWYHVIAESEWYDYSRHPDYPPEIKMHMYKTYAKNTSLEKIGRFEEGGKGN